MPLHNVPHSSPSLYHNSHFTAAAINCVVASSAMWIIAKHSKATKTLLIRIWIKTHRARGRRSVVLKASEMDKSSVSFQCVLLSNINVLIDILALSWPLSILQPLVRAWCECKQKWKMGQSNRCVYSKATGMAASGLFWEWHRLCNRTSARRHSGAEMKQSRLTDCYWSVDFQL